MRNFLWKKVSGTNRPGDGRSEKKFPKVVGFSAEKRKNRNGNNKNFFVPIASLLSLEASKIYWEFHHGRHEV